MARPTSYTKEIGELICEQLADGKSLLAICKKEEMPHKTTVYRWLLSDNDQHDEFRTNYALAREIQYQSMADELMDIADDGTNDYVFTNSEEGDLCRVNPEAIGRSRLRVDTRKWFMSKVLPKFKEKEQDSANADIASILSQIIASRPD